MSESVVSEVVILPFEARHAAAWNGLNEGWIARMFTIEPKDRIVLDDPVGQIITPGGHILMAEIDGRPVGCCALIAMTDGGYELAKMAVDENLRGRGIGKRLMTAAVALARELKAPRLYIETNSSLKNAIGLYEAHGFRHMAAQPTAYARCDVWMELTLAPDRAQNRA
jgi:putative acetyltransferase